jgi:hypothetical protein
MPKSQLRGVLRGLKRRSSRLAHEFSMWRGIAATDPKCANMSPERREELAARFAFDQFASRMPESFRAMLEAGRESILETMLAEAGTELKIN